MRNEAEQQQRNASLLATPEWYGTTPVEWIVMQPNKDPNNAGRFIQLPYPTHVSLLVCRAIYALDSSLTVQSHDEVLVGSAGQTSESEPTWHALIETERKIIEGIRRDDANNMCVGILNGVAPIWNHLNHTFARPKYRDVQQRIHSTIINGYNGVGAELPHVLVPLSNELASAHLIYVLDDLIDSGKSIALFLEEVVRMRGKTVDKTIVDRLSKIKDAPFEQYANVYAHLIDRLHTEGIIVSTAFYKNAPFLREFHTHIQDAKTTNTVDEWVRVQEDMLSHVLVFGQHDWLKGRGLDTGIKGSTLTPLIRDMLLKEDLLDSSAEEILFYIEHSLIRVGSFVERLIILKDNNLDGLTHLTATYLFAYIKRFVQQKGAGIANAL